MEGVIKLNKKDNIVRAAVKIFSEKGIEKTKISDIVKEAGVAQGTFYLYFPSKLSLMPAIAEIMVEKTLTIIKGNVQDDVSFSTKIEQIIDSIFMVTRDYNELQALIYAGLASTEHLKEWEAVYNPFYVWVSDLLREAQSEGVIRESIHVERTAKIMIGLIESAAEQIYLYDSDKDDQARIQKIEVNQFVKHALGVMD